MAARRHSSSNVFEVTLFSLMVAAVATGFLVVVLGFDLLTACFLGPGVGIAVAIILSVLLRRREPRAARGPVRVGAGTHGTPDAPPRGARSGSASAEQGSDPAAPRAASEVEPRASADVAPRATTGSAEPSH